jgi:PAT family beta-lactamase induction signal transducer AmpG
MRLRLTTRRGRLVAFFLLYLSEGIPFGFTAVTMTAYLRRHGVGLEAIGLFAASLYAPWGFKWAWAPLVDLVRIERFGASRTWIVFAQSMMILTIGVVLFFDPVSQLGLVTALIVVHNVFAATQDIAIDALAVRVLPEQEMGVANGLMFAAAYIGQAIGGGGALFVAGKLGYSAAFVFMLGALAVLLFAVSMPLLEPASAAPGSASATLGRAAGRGREAVARIRLFLGDLYASFFRAGRGPLLGVVLAILPQGAVALGLALATTIPVDLGMSEEQIAGLSLLSSLASALGCVAGGWVSDRVGHRKSLAAWYALTALPPLFLAWRLWDWPIPGGGGAVSAGVAGVDARLYTIVAACFAVASGLQYGTGNAVFMGLSSKKVAATQFTGYMALKNLALSYSNVWQGRMASTHGYARTLLIDGIGAAVPLLVLPFLGAPRRPLAEPAPVAPPAPSG